MAARVGLFLCQGEQPQASDELSWSVSGNGTRGPVFRIGRPDTAEGAAELIKLIKENDLSGFVAAACPPLGAGGTLFKEMGKAGLDPEMGLCLDLGPRDNLDEYLARPQNQLAITQALAAQLRRAVPPKEPFTVFTRVLVVGAGLSALLTAKELAGSGYEVVVLNPEEELPAVSARLGREARETASALVQELGTMDKVTFLAGTRLKSLRGAVGRFTAVCATPEGFQSMEAGAVVVAQGPPLQADTATLGVQPSKRVLPLSRAAGLTEDDLKALAPSEGPFRVALALGVGSESEPLNLRAGLDLGLKAIRDLDGRSLLLTGNAKVAAPDLEELTQTAKQEGMLIAKLTEPKASARDQGETVELTFLDEILGLDVVQELDLLVIDEVPAADPGSAKTAYAELACALGLSLARDGFLQPDQVNALPIMTPRKGVFAVGPAQGRVDVEERHSQARAAALSVRNLLKNGTLDLAAPVEIIDTGKCAVCLTCVRVCPEGAMITDYDKPASNPLACTGCGTCASECPQDAIRMLNESDEVYTSQISAAKAAAAAEGPEMLVFLCANSAAQAVSRARQEGWEAPAGVRFVRVPCASKIDPAFVLQAFSEGFDGVLVLSCFEDACYSLKGNTWLGYRADHLQNLLTEAGIEPGRLRRAGIAPSMKAEPTALIEAMAAELAQMGPAGLRPSHRELQERFTLELGTGSSVTP